MHTRTRPLLGWIPAVLLIVMNLPAIFFKFVPQDPASQAAVMARQLGFADIQIPLGIVELLVVVLFAVPRTSTVGVVLMAGYLSGALATNLTHGIPVAEAAPLLVALALLALSAWFRNPELVARLRGRKIPA